MARVCQICGKRPRSGNIVVRRGLAKRKGGVGIKTTKVVKRWFKPNIRKIRVLIDGKVRRIKVCTDCIRKGKIQKPIYRKAIEQIPI